MNDPNIIRYDMIDYLTILIRLVKSKKARIEELDAELDKCIKNPEHIMPPNLNKKLADLKRDVAEKEDEIKVLRDTGSTVPLSTLLPPTSTTKEYSSATQAQQDTLDSMQRRLDKLREELKERRDREAMGERGGIEATSLEPIPAIVTEPVPAIVTESVPKTSDVKPDAGTSTTTAGTNCTEPMHPYITNDASLAKLGDELKLYQVDDLVDMIVGGSFKQPRPEPGGATLVLSKKDVNENYRKGVAQGYELNDEQTGADFELKNIMSELTILHFAETAEAATRFINLVVGLFQVALEEYVQKKGLRENDVIFVYKGGNALRAVFLKYTYENPGISADIIKSYFGEAFNKSDADFQIYINPVVAGYEDVLMDMKNMTFLLLNRIRNIFLKHIDRWFDFYKYKSAYMKTVLEGYLGKLNQSSIVKEGGGQFVSLRFLDTVASLWADTRVVSLGKPTRFDYVVRNNPDQSDSVLIYTIPPLQETVGAGDYKDVRIQEKLFGKYPGIGSELFLIYNDAIEVAQAVPVGVGVGQAGEEHALKIRNKFTLIRMKVNFQAILKKDNKNQAVNVPAELIDVAIPHKSAYDFKVDTQQEWDEFVAKGLQKYNYASGSKTFGYTSYTYRYYINDLEVLLFKEVRYPWQREKYEKRIKRLLFLYMSEMFVTSPDEGYVVVTKFKSMLQGLDGSGDVRGQLENFKSDPAVKDKSIVHLVDNFIQFSGYSDFDLEDPKVKEYIRILTDFCDRFVEIYEGFKKFISDGRIDKDRLQIVHQLGGLGGLGNGSLRSREIK